MAEIYLNKLNVYTLSHNGMMAYTSLKIEMDKRLKITKDQTEFIICTNEDFMIYDLFGSFDTKVATRYFKENLIKGLQELQEYEFIKIIESNKKNYVLDVSGLIIDVKNGDKYFTTNTDEIRKILNIKTKDIFGLFHYAIAIISTIWNGSKCYGCDSIEQLCDKSDIQSNKTVITYNSLLEENHIIYIKRNEYANRNEDGTIQRQANTYGRYENKKAIIEASEKYNQNTYDNTKRVSSNEKQSIKAKYNNFLKGTYKGTVEELKELVDKYNNDPYIIKYNNKIDDSVFWEQEEDMKEKPKAFNKREPRIDIEPTEEELQEIENNPVTIDIEPIEETPIKKLHKPTYEQLVKWGFNENDIKELGVMTPNSTLDDYDRINKDVLF